MPENLDSASAGPSLSAAERFYPLQTMPSTSPPTKRARWEKLSRKAPTQPRCAIELAQVSGVLCVGASRGGSL